MQERLTKKELIITMALQGLLSSYPHFDHAYGSGTDKFFVPLAIKYGSELFKYFEDEKSTGKKP